MAEAVYRAAFIRMHPTGKVVLSLSEAAKSRKKTEELAGVVAAELGIPPGSSMPPWVRTPATCRSYFRAAGQLTARWTILRMPWQTWTELPG
jgi:hypothetical protein